MQKITQYVAFLPNRLFVHHHALEEVPQSGHCAREENFVSAEAYVDGCVSPVCFDSPAIADTLRWATGGFNGSLFGLASNSFAYKLQPSLSLASSEASLRIERSQILPRIYNIF